MAQPRIALYLQDKHDMRYELEMAKYAEERGFSELWQADTRLARDCIVMMSAFLACTHKLRLGSGVLPIWTRNPAVIAATFSTMWELGGKCAGRGRRHAGPGGLVGAHRRPGGRRPAPAAESHARARRSHPAAVHHARGHLPGRVRAILTGSSLDVAFGDTCAARHSHLYRRHRRPDARIGRRSLRRRGIKLRRLGRLHPTGDCPGGKRRPQSRAKPGRDRPARTDRCAAFPTKIRRRPCAEGKKLVAYYLATEPHIMKASGVSQDLLEKVQALMTWPATEADYIRAGAGHPGRSGAQPHGGWHHRGMPARKCASTWMPGSPVRSSFR